MGADNTDGADCGLCIFSPENTQYQLVHPPYNTWRPITPAKQCENTSSFHCLRHCHHCLFVFSFVFVIVIIVSLSFHLSLSLLLSNKNKKQNLMKFLLGQTPHRFYAILITDHNCNMTAKFFSRERFCIAILKRCKTSLWNQLWHVKPTLKSTSIRVCLTSIISRSSFFLAILESLDTP